MSWIKLALPALILTGCVSLPKEKNHPMTCTDAGHGWERCSNQEITMYLYYTFDGTLVVSHSHMTSRQDINMTPSDLDGLPLVPPGEAYESYADK